MLTYYVCRYIMISMKKIFNADGMLSLRKKRQLSLDKLARQIDNKYGLYTTNSTLSLYEQNKIKNPSLILVGYLAEIFEVKLDFFITDIIE